MKERRSAGGGRWPLRAAAVTGLLALMVLITSHERLRHDRSDSQAQNASPPAGAVRTHSAAPGAASRALAVPPVAPPAQAPGTAAPAQPAVVQAADPVRIRVPRVGINGAIVPLDVVNNSLSVPTAFENAGWWRDGPEPGEPGPAVIAGHVDSRTGPAVFYRLRELRAGDQILVDRVDGTTATFVIERMEQHNKNSFPNQSVYGDTADSQLRLVTCGGAFDTAAHRYVDNIIAYARAVG